MTDIVYLGPGQEKYIVTARVYAVRGQVVSVSAAVAGWPPCTTGEDDDPGAGLLAQEDVWAPAGSPRALEAARVAAGLAADVRALVPDHVHRQPLEDPGARLARFLAATSVTEDDPVHVFGAGAERSDQS